MKQELLEVIDPTNHEVDLDTTTTHRYRKGNIVAQEFNYKTWARKIAHDLEGEITDNMCLAAKIALRSFRWCYHIVGKDLELFDNVDLSHTLKAEKNIQI